MAMNMRTRILTYRQDISESLGGLDCPEERYMAARLIAKCDKRLNWSRESGPIGQ
jgi:hypothetical protein